MCDTLSNALRLLDLLELDIKRLVESTTPEGQELLKSCAEHRLQIANKIRYAATMTETSVDRTGVRNSLTESMTT